MFPYKRITLVEARDAMAFVIDWGQWNLNQAAIIMRAINTGCMADVNNGFL